MIPAGLRDKNDLVVSSLQLKRGQKRGHGTLRDPKVLPKHPQSMYKSTTKLFRLGRIPGCLEARKIPDHTRVRRMPRGMTVAIGEADLHGR